jgi:mitochondrial chaperone BCS1
LVLVDLIRNITRFLDKKSPKIYTRKKILYRRDYFLESLPRTRKILLIYIIIKKFGLDIYIPNITNILESELKHLFNTLSYYYIIILEDINQTSFNNRKNQETSKKKKKNIFFSGFFNIIDRIMSYENYLLFMTTNYIERLNKALIRPGRINKIISFKIFILE